MCTDILTAENIEKYLSDSYKYKILFYDTVDSTNTLLKRKAEENAPEFTVAVASAQTAGKGRMGKNFYSPEQTGVYVSFLLRPKISPQKVVTVTAAAAVAACEAVKIISDEKPAVKWVNDIFLDGKKVCGILAETATDEKGKIKYVVLGAGFNVYAPTGGFPPEIQKTAGHILKTPRKDAKSRLAAEFINFFMSVFFENTPEKTHEKYRKLCFVPGKKVKVISNGTETPAEALFIDDEYRLVVRYGDDKTEALSSGEISVKI